MTEQQILDAYPEIFSELSNYAVINNKDGRLLKYTIFYRATNGYVIVEQHSDLVAELMIKRGVPIYDNESEAWNLEYKPHSLKWDDQKQEWVKVYHKDL